MKKIEPMTHPDKIKQSLYVFNHEDISLEAWNTLTQSVYQHNTLLSLQNDWRVFVQFCLQKKYTALPASIQTLEQFIHEKLKTRKISSIKRYIITIGRVHQIHSQDDPCKHRQIRFLINQIYREKASEFQQATPFHLHHLNALYDKLKSSERIKDLRDLIIWTLCFEAMLKRSELVAIQVDHLIYRRNTYYLCIHDQVIELSQQASQLIQKWLDITQIKNGCLLRRINKHQQFGEAPLDHSSIYRVFRRAATELHYQAFTFSGQSARVGATQELSDAGKSIKEIQHLGRWKSPAMPAQYVGNEQAKIKAMQHFKRKIERD